MRFILWVNKATDTHSDYVTQIYFPNQQLLRAALGVTGLGFVCVCVCIHISRCIQIMYKFQDTLYPLMHFPVQENMDLFLREIYYLNPEL